MATLILTTVGTLVGGPIGGAIGAVIGQSLDAALFAPQARQGPRLGDLAVQTSSYGTPIPKLFGTMRVAGTVIWSTDLIERRATSGGGKGRPKTVDYSYAASFAVALSARRIVEVRRIWADGKLLRGAAGDFKTKTGFRLYAGSEDQAPDPLIAAAEGAGQAPAFRGIAYALFEEMELAEFGNRIPSLSFEVVADAAPVAIGTLAAELSGGVLSGDAGPDLRGYAASGDSVRGAVEELAELAGLGLRDADGLLALTEAGEPAAALGRSSESGRRALVRRAAGQVPGEVTLTYYDAARDYQAGLQRASAGPAPAARVERRGLPAVLAADEAKALAERRLDALWGGRVSATITCGWAAAAMRPGALLALEGESGRWRVRRWTLGDMRVKLELVRTSAGAAAVIAAGSAGRPVRETDRPAAATDVRLIELPAPDGAPDRPLAVALAAGAQAGWRGAALSVSFDAGASWRDIGAAAAPAVIGTALGALPAGRSALFDRRSFVEIELLHEEMALAARSDDALVGGANLALLGEELVQFGAAERIGPRRWRLGRLLRGRRGTEWAAGAHRVGEGFALIEADSALPLELPDGLGAGGAVQLLASGVADTAPAEAALLLTGAWLRPPAPVHLRATTVPSGGGDVLLSWARRSRRGWSWASGSDAPLGEEREVYRLTLSGAGAARSVELTVPAYVYTAAERAADGPAPVEARVVQIGTHGGSRPAMLILP